MERKRSLILAATFALLIGFVFLPPYAHSAPKFLTIGSTSTSSSHYSYFVAIAK